MDDSEEMNTESITETASNDVNTSGSSFGLFSRNLLTKGKSGKLSEEFDSKNFSYNEESKDLSSDETSEEYDSNSNSNNSGIKYKGMFSIFTSKKEDKKIKEKKKKPIVFYDKPPSKPANSNFYEYFNRNKFNRIKKNQ